MPDRDGNSSSCPLGNGYSEEPVKEFLRQQAEREERDANPGLIRRAFSMWCEYVGNLFAG
jgi:hypothetical protein